MQTYPQVDEYMKLLDLKYFKNTQDFVAHVMINSDKEYTTELVNLLNSRATGKNSNNDEFYRLKNRTLSTSLAVSAAFDGGVFRHIGNMIIDNPEAFSGTVLDIGCDCGIVTCFIAKIYPNSKVVGIDCNPLAVANGTRLAELLKIPNVEFVEANAYDYKMEDKADTITSFRCLLDITQAQTKGVPTIGERAAREERYKDAFSPLAQAISNNLKDDGMVISVERYTPLYGWLGWLMALEGCGIYSISDKCCRMTAQDISNTIEYSVTMAKKDGSSESSCMNTYDSVMLKQFKSGAGCMGADAEFAFYYDSVKAELKEIYKDDKIIHVFATGETEKGKYMYFEEDLDNRKIKYLNEKKMAKMQEELDEKLALYSDPSFKINTIIIK